MTKRRRAPRAPARDGSERPPEGEPPVVLYRTADDATRVALLRSDDQVWATQAQMAELFQTTVANINIHLKHIFAEGELDPAASVKSYLIDQVQRRSTVRREVLHYDLSVVLAVGYRVRTPRGTEFRQWATEHLREYLVKGFVLDDQRLKHPGPVDYFDELLERIRDIRASEQRMYLRVRDILALAADYRPSDAETTEMFQAIQNKLHFAVTGKTAPELIAERADHAQPNMGLTVWKGDVVRKGDVTVAKNFLRGDEIGELNRLVGMLLDYAEDQARRRKQIFLREWRSKVDDFLRFNDRQVLPGAGRVSREAANRHALDEYARFEARRRELAEQAGADDALAALVESAKQIPARTGRERKKEPR